MEGDWKCPEIHIQSEQASIRPLAESVVCRLKVFSCSFSGGSVDGSIISTIVINHLHGVHTAQYSAPSFRYHLKQRHLPKLRYASVSLEKSISCFNFPAVFLWTAKKGAVWVGQWDDKRIFPWRNRTTGWIGGAGKNKISWVVFI